MQAENSSDGARGYERDAQHDESIRLHGTSGTGTDAIASYCGRPDRGLSPLLATVSVYLVYRLHSASGSETIGIETRILAFEKRSKGCVNDSGHLRIESLANIIDDLRCTYIVFFCSLSCLLSGEYPSADSKSTEHEPP